MDLAFLSFEVTLTIISTSIVWLMLRFVTGSTKYAWALSLAIGYTIGHISLIASHGLEAESFFQKLSAWMAALPAAGSAVFRPKNAIDWMPIGTLLAGLVSVNAAVFGFERLITIVGASLISVLLVLELAGSKIADTAALFSLASGLPVLCGMAVIWIGWLSLQRSMTLASAEDASGWPWISSVAVLMISIIFVLWMSGAQMFAQFGIMIFATLLGAMLVSIVGKGTMHIRYAGAFIAAGSLGLLLSAWWFTELKWYPVPILLIGFAAVGFWLPQSLSNLPYARTSISVFCSVAAMIVAAVV